ncbi:hypothetical protein KAU51_00945 [Candidatus Parcubacteria bacterium]|nr:hypothetical protein [Candidatus Parcubacteria bacterium]
MIIKIPDELIEKIMDVARAEKRAAPYYNHYPYKDTSEEQIIAILEQVCHKEGAHFGLLLEWQVKREKNKRNEERKESDSED